MAFSLFNFGKGEGNDNGSNQKVVQIKLDQIVPNRYQPRQVFDKDGIRELSETISQHGLLQPIILREYEPAKFEIIAGERRFRAMKLLEWDAAPAIVEKMTDQESASLALIENLQRSQLSSVEEAQAYQRLIDLNNLTQAALAKGMGKSQSFVANKLRLLKLIKPVQTAILDNRITERHGRAMLDLDEKQQRDMLMKVVNERMTVRQTEDEVARVLGRPLPSEIAKQKAEAKKKAMADLAPEASLVQDQPAPEPKKTAKKAKAKTKPAKKINDSRLAINTIKKAIKLATDSGFTVKTKETDDDNTYQLVIEIPKKQ
ncbi:MAG: ParB/RepB/Spo0J family partition protein [Limosilactobacillus sp.]|uniref:ParB/RepB/Spo0J family partition protein n=1 Tax=Limosilactobacillus sp. TaxID=2773925 RepID=UPI002710CF46|nr:ParB/RepB/Spo0J family partition protein [Limosilactobacillus sp.]